jgi:hypothetical protein
MVDEDIQLGSAQRIDFVDHHRNYCNIDAHSCPDRAMIPRIAARKTISALVSRGIDDNTCRMLKDESEPSFEVQGTISGILRHCNDIETGIYGRIKMSSLIKDDLARACLQKISSGDEEGLKRLAGLFPDNSSLDYSLTKVFAKEFKLSVKQLRELL